MMTYSMAGRIRWWINSKPRCGAGGEKIFTTTPRLKAKPLVTIHHFRSFRTENTMPYLFLLRAMSLPTPFFDRPQSLMSYTPLGT
jgi:hypothetical protein